MDNNFLILLETVIDKSSLTDAQKKIDDAEAAVGTKLEDGKAKLEELYELERDGERLLAEAQAQMDEEYSKVQSQLQNGNDEYLAAVNEYNANVQTLSAKQI